MDTNDENVEGLDSQHEEAIEAAKAAAAEDGDVVDTIITTSTTTTTTTVIDNEVGAPGGDSGTDTTDTTDPDCPPCTDPPVNGTLVYEHVVNKNFIGFPVSESRALEIVTNVYKRAKISMPAKYELTMERTALNDQLIKFYSLNIGE